jgi:mycothiol synthase
MDEIVVSRREPGFTAKRGHLLAASRPEYRLTESILREKLERVARPGDEAFAFEAVVNGEIVGFIQAIARRAKHKGYIAALAVEPGVRRRGVGGLMLKFACEALRGDGAHSIEVFGIPGNYLVPGVEPRLLDLVVSLESAGFRRFADTVNLRVWPSSRGYGDTSMLDHAESPAAFRFATIDDAEPLARFLAEKFSDDWRHEVAHAFSTPGAGVCLALDNGRIVGFAGHSIQNRELGFFGPMGVDPEYRGRGIGLGLLVSCLEALRAAGHASAIIPWVGPISFYTQCGRCELDGVFWRYALDCSG